MTKKIILSTALGFMFMLGVQAQQEQKVAPSKTKSQVIKNQNNIKHPEANVNFDEVQDTRTLGQSNITMKTLNLNGMVVGDKRSSTPLTIDDTRTVSIEFQSDNKNAMYYLVDKLDNLVIPARQKAYNGKLQDGEYVLKVGLLPEAVKNNEKVEYSFIIK